MRRHGWSADWQPPEGWKPPTEWGPGARAWQGFGRKILLGLVLAFAFGVLVLVTVGAVLTMLMRIVFSGEVARSRGRRENQFPPAAYHELPACS